MSKDLLKVGNLLVLRNGEILEVEENGVLRGERQVSYLTQYHENLKNKFEERFDIVKIINY